MIKGLTPSSDTNAPGIKESSGINTFLTDGAIGAGAGSTDNSARYVVGNGESITYSLPTSAAGFDISKINFYTVWNDSGRSDIWVGNVSYATFAAPTTFVAIPSSSLTYNPGTGTGLASLTASGGLLASGVASIRFNFANPQENTYVGYGELEVVGFVPGTGGTNLLPSATPVQVASGATLDLNGNSQTVASLSDLGGGGGTVTSSASSTTATLTINPASGSTSFSGNITDSGSINAISLVKLGAGTQVLAGSSTYAGGTTISSGTLKTGNNNALGTGNVTVGGGTLSVGTGISHSNSLIASASTISSVVYNGGSSSLTGNLTGSGTVNFSDTSGNQTSFDVPVLPNASGFTGTIGINTDTSNVWFPTVVNGGGASANWVVTGTGSTSTSGSFLFANGTAEGLGSLSGNGTIGAYTSNTMWSIGALNGNSTFSGLIINNSVAAGTASLNKVGSGTLTLSGNNSSYSGTTTMTGGILNVASVSNYGANSSLGNRSLAVDQAGVGGLQFQGGTLQYTGLTAQSTNRYVSASASATAATIDSSSLTPGATLSFTQAGGANTYFWIGGGSRTVTLAGSNTGNNLGAEYALVRL